MVVSPCRGGVNAVVDAHTTACPALQLFPCYLFDLKALAAVGDGVKSLTGSADDPNSFCRISTF